MDQLTFSAIHYKAVRERLAAEDPSLDEQTLGDTVEGLTDLHEILASIIRAFLADEALASGLKGRIAEMEQRLERLQDRAAKRRQIVRGNDGRARPEEDHGSRFHRLAAAGHGFFGGAR
jgi:hypothetical protein